MQMIRDLFINGTIIVSAITFTNLLFRDKSSKSSFFINILYGFLSGLLGCILMIFSVSVTPDIIIDFRNIPIIVMAIYFSPIAAIEAAAMIVLFRILYFGVSSASITAIIAVLLVSIVSSLIGSTKATIKIKWLTTVASLCLISGTGIFYLVHTLDNRLEILLVYLIGTIIISILMFFFMEFISSRNRRYEQLKNEAELDFLTGLKNCRYFDKSINKYIQEAMQENRKISLLYIDVDYFKAVNDRYGHTKGDLVLQELGRILKRVARTHDVVTRKGGEEFAILLVDCGLDPAVKVAERVRRTVEEHEFRLSSHNTARITISVGVASIPETAYEEVKLVEQADAALYQAKHNGRNKVAIISQPLASVKQPEYEIDTSMA